MYISANVSYLRFTQKPSIHLLQSSSWSNLGELIAARLNCVRNQAVSLPPPNSISLTYLSYPFRLNVGRLEWRRYFYPLRCVRDFLLQPTLVLYHA